MNSRFLTMTCLPRGPGADDGRPGRCSTARLGGTRCRRTARTTTAPRMQMRSGAPSTTATAMGVKRGEQAARDNRPFDVAARARLPERENGYNRSLGDRNRYRDNYRGGFTAGLPGRLPAGRDVPRIGRYPNGRDGGPRMAATAVRPSYGAYQNGASDGYKKGLDDVQRSQEGRRERQKWYRSGDHDYDSRYGSKETYRVEYRRGFEEGYNRAYRERDTYPGASPSDSRHASSLAAPPARSGRVARSRPLARAREIASRSA